jgi:hypothetical protein
LTAIPLFYSNPVALDPSLHAGLGLPRALDYGFARGVAAIPISLAEIAPAAVWYPIVFLPGETPTPVAVVGLRDGENLFVGESGQWADGAYVPALVRRFPFVFAEYGSGEGVTLCVEAGILEPDAERPLFVGDQPSRLVKQAMKFCTACLAASRATDPFVALLVEHDLLAPRTVSVGTPDGRTVELGGFLSIDEHRFRALPDETFLALRRKGWMAAIYAQLNAALNWTRLADRIG